MTVRPDYVYAVPGYGVRNSYDGVYQDQIPTYIANQDAGKQLGYIEKVDAPFTTTNITAGAAAGDITGLTFSFVGNGRIVDLEFNSPNTSHATPGASVAAVIVVDGNLVGPMNQTGLVESPQTLASAGGPTLHAKRGVPTVKGQSYTVKVNVRGSIAGLTTLGAAAYTAITLAAISR